MASTHTGTGYTILTVGIGRVAELDDSHHRTHAASTTAEALGVLDERPVDCVVSEYDVGDRTVLHLLDEIRDGAPPPPVLVWTRHGSERKASDAVCNGAAAYLPRSDDDQQAALVETVDDLAATYRTSNPSNARGGRPGPQAADQSAAFLSVVDETGWVEHVGAVEDSFGHSPASLLDGRYFEHVHSAGVDDARTALERAVSGEAEAATARVRFRAGDGGWRAAVVSFQPLATTGDDARVLATTRAVAAGATRGDRPVSPASRTGPDGVRAPDLEADVGLMFRQELEDPVGQEPGPSVGQELGAAVGRELRDCIEQERALSTLTQRALEDPSLASLFDDAAELVGDVLGHDYSGVFELESAERALALRNGCGWDDGAVGSASVASDNGSQAGYTLREADPVVVTDLSNDARCSRSDLLERHGATSGISAIIGPVEDPWGVLATHDTTPRTYADHDVNFVRSVAYVLYTARERQARSRELERYETIVESIDENVWVSDGNNEVAFLNERAAAALEDHPEAVVGDSMHSLFTDALSVPKADANEVIQGLEGMLTGDMTEFDIELPLQTTDSHVRLDVRFAPMAYEDEITHVIGVARDVTERSLREQQLETSRRKYRTMIEAAPDPILAYDTTGEVVECNAAAEALWGTPRDALVGSDAAALHPDDERDRYLTLIEDTTSSPRHVRWFDDGDPVLVETGCGDELEVEVSAERVELADRTLVFGIFRDVSERRWFESSLTALQEMGSRLPEAETATAIAETVVDTTTSVFEHSSAAIYRYDESDGVLRPAADSGDLPASVDPLPTFQPGESPLWRAFETGEIRTYDDVDVGDAACNWPGSLQSALIAPLADHGVLVAGDTRQGTFDDRRVELAELLVADATAALNRASREESLRQRRSELRRQNQQFEAISRVGAVVTDLSQRLIDADTRGEIDDLLCSSLTELEAVSFAWVAGRADGEERLFPRSWDGGGESYIDALDLNLDQTIPDGEPTTRAFRTQSVVDVPAVTGETGAGDWKRAALYRDYRSCLSMPITYRDGSYGVLSVYGSERDAFGRPVEQVLQHLATFAGYAMNAVEIRSAALHSRSTELEFAVDDSSDTLYRIADDLDCRVVQSNTVPRADDESVHELAVEGVDAEAFERELADAIAVERFSSHDGRPDAYEVVLSETGLAGRVLELGGTPKRIVMEGAESALTVELSTMTDVRTFVQQLNDRDTVTLKSQKTRDSDASRASTTMMDRLTDRQREVLQTAYEYGYYEQPRENSGQDVADVLGISQPAFSNHLRKAEQVLVGCTIEEQLGAPTEDRGSRSGESEVERSN